MKRFPLLAFLLFFTTTACKTAEDVAREVLKSTPGGRRALADFDRYAKIAHILKRYHDSGTLQEGDVLEVLRSAGVYKGPSRVPGGKLPPGMPTRPPGRKPPPFPVPVYDGKYRWPLDAGVVSSEFKMRWGRPHNGLDIAADLGVPVFPAAPGEVVYAGDGLRGYGNVVIVRHDEKTTTLYAHNKALKVRNGDKATPDRAISLLGSTGRSTGPHVHFEIREGDKPINPRERLPKSRF